MQIVRAGAFHDLVHIGVVEAALLGFELLPVDRRLHGVGMQRGHRLPHLRQLAGPSAGVMNLAAENQIGSAFDHERVAAILLDELRSFDC